jgi:hypothetical protein
MIHLLFGLLVAAVPSTIAPAGDEANIALSEAVLKRVGDTMWPSWSSASFAIDLLTANGPVEINFEKPIPAPSFPPDLEATFPWDNNVPTIVIGEPQFTQAKTPIRWSVVLMHEHFHQWQDAWPRYFASVKDLGLDSSGGKSAMWMLNYPFPYNNLLVNQTFANMAGALADAVDAIGAPRFADAADRYLGLRRLFKAHLTKNDYKYFAFQCWQEGAARYTEIAVARMAAQAHASDPQFLTDDQARDLSDDSAATLAGVEHRLRTIALSEGGRGDFYALGAGEALLLDQVKPGWRTQYLDPRMDLSNFF